MLFVGEVASRDALENSGDLWGKQIQKLLDVVLFSAVFDSDGRLPVRGSVEDEAPAQCGNRHFVGCCQPLCHKCERSCTAYHPLLL